MTASTSTSVASAGLRTAGRPAARQPARRRARRSESRRSVRRWTSPCGRTRSPVSRVGPRPSVTDDRVGTPSASSCHWDCSATDFDLHCGGLDLQVPAPRERAGPGRRGRSRLLATLGSQRAGDGGRREDEQVARQLHVAHRTLAETSDPRAYRLLVLRSHYRSPIEVTTDDHRRRRARAGAPRRLGATFRVAGAGRRHARSGVGRTIRR